MRAGTKKLLYESFVQDSNSSSSFQLWSELVCVLLSPPLRYSVEGCAVDCFQSFRDTFVICGMRTHGAEHVGNCHVVDDGSSKLANHVC